MSKGPTGGPKLVLLVSAGNAFGSLCGIDGCWYAAQTVDYLVVGVTGVVAENC